MSKIQNFDGHTARLISDAMLKALKVVEQEFGVVFSAHGGRYSSDGKNYTPKIEVSTLSKDGSVQSREVENFKKYAKMDGLNPEDLGREFMMRGELFKIVGYNANARKNPIIIEKGGKRFVCRSDTVVRCLASMKPIAFKKGDKVVADYEGGMYPGKYVKPGTKAGTHHIAFDDGDKGISTLVAAR